MPTITASLSEQAYEIWRELEKGKRSRQLSAALVQWKHQLDAYHEQKMKERLERDLDA